MTKIERRCPICGSESGEVLYTHRLELPELLKFMPDFLRIICCEDCGMIYVRSKANQELYNRYYKTICAYSVDRNEYCGDGYENDQELKFREKEYEIIETYINSSYNVVDIGSGTGIMLQIFQRHGYCNVVGIDVDDKEALMKAKGIRFLQGDIQSLDKFESASFGPLPNNLFILNMVLEHIFDLKSAMVSLTAAMKKNDLLFVTVPDTDEYLSCSGRPFRYIPLEHINHFTKRTLQTFFENWGLEVLTWGNFKSPVRNEKPNPVLYMLLKKREYHRDLSGRKNMIAYIKKSCEDDADLQEKIGELAVHKRELIIWGAGTYFMALLGRTRLAECNIKFLVDNNRTLQGNQISGIEVVDPQRILDYPDSCVCLASAAHSENILREIKQMELPNDVIIL